MNILNKIKKIHQKEQINPSFLGMFVNPFYFARKGLYDGMLEFSPLLSGSILDIGCGDKPYKDLFVNVNNYIGLEIDDRRNREMSLADYFYDGKEFPFENKSYDGILSNQVFEHIFNPNEFLKEVNRVLKQDGLFLITVPFVWDEHEQPYDYARYSSFGIKHVLNKHGFEIVKNIKTNNGIGTIAQLLNTYIFKTINTKNGYINIILTILLMSPINILGTVFAKLTPKNNDLYLDNIVLARKKRDA
ncbi:class I SAM-dependent methyltransferase [Gammaproteobacteria bacterium]|nr:class I SAM-dependent methyltransferase [Gammaproteobacteria bacterium]